MFRTGSYVEIVEKHPYPCDDCVGKIYKFSK